MPKLNSITELQELRSRIQDDPERNKPRLVICAGTACQASGANDLNRIIKRHLIERHLVDHIALRITGCHGFCEMGPFILVEPQGAFYTPVKKKHVPKIISAVLAEEYVEELLYTDPSTNKRYFHFEDIPFFKKQQRTLLGRNQEIDPIRFFHFLGTGGYVALEKALGEYSPKQVVDQVKLSRLRGRGGGGFPTGLKWELAAKENGDRGKYVVCNADEGDPGAYMDRSILEGNPHSVIEGMIIGGYAMGATEGVIFVRHEYPLAIKHTIIALRLAREYGLLGEKILGTDFSFDINIVKSAGAFVCGEETALIKTVEGYMGEPRQRPPYPTQKGIYGKPTSINNVETWANVPVVIEQGAAEYAKIGTENSTGTKVFSVVGKIRNTGLVEVPMGTSIKSLVYDIGGGAQKGSKIKAVQIGGPSGGCIPSWRFDLPIDYDSLTEAGAIMGSGGMIVMDEDTCMVDVAKYFMGFLKAESCGKCFTCRKGTQRMWEILDDITCGRGSLDQLDLLEELAHVVKDTTMCGLGQSAPNPVLSTLRYFRHEYERHIVDKRCDAFVCKDLVGAPCQSACPIGTEAWRYVAHIGRGEYEAAYAAIRETNPFPSVCARVCDHNCESRCRLGTTGESPVAIRALKRYVTDTIDPASFKPVCNPANGHRVAVVGAGPGGLTAAHYLSLEGYGVTIFEASDHAGGMLSLGIPSYRLPREVMSKEIDALLNDNIELVFNTTLGKDLDIDDLLHDRGFEAVFLAMGALKSRRLMIDNEDVEGVYPSMQFLRACNHQNKSLAKGHVGVIGGGNSALDAARVAIRQEGVESVTILYRRTRDEMPAFSEEIEAALEEGVELVTLTTPIRVLSENGQLTGIECLKNKLGKHDASGRRSPKAIEGSEFEQRLDTLVVAISEEPDTDNLFSADSAGLAATKWGSLEINEVTLATGRPGVFAGGDVVTGPNTVVEAIAAGKKAALMIDRYVRRDRLQQEVAPRLPDVYVEPVPVDADRPRAKPPSKPVEERLAGFTEVEQPLGRDQAHCEAARCLRCDLEFTEAPRVEPATQAAAGGAR